MIGLTPEQMAKYDQAAAGIREHINQVVAAYRFGLAAGEDELTCRSAMLLGFTLSGPDKTLAMAVMAISMLAEKES